MKILKYGVLFFAFLSFPLMGKPSWWNSSESEKEIAPLPKDYQSKKACEKQTFLWEKKILPSKYKKLPQWVSTSKWTFVSLSKKFLKVTMDYSGDQMPPKRKKLIRPFGTTAKVKFVSTNPKYTGLYQGAKCGFARMTLVGEPEKEGFSPGMSLKLFVDHKPSGDLLVMNTIPGQGQDRNFFAKDLSNIIPQGSSFKEKIINKVFKRAAKITTHLSINHLSEINEKGQKVDKLRSPERIFFHPSKGAQISSSSKNDFRKDLSLLKKGTKIYDVLVSESKDGKKEKIGELILTSSFVASSYSDKYLFFKHYIPKL
jgi:hypothetical protein